jgi:hypothetical protein
MHGTSVPVEEPSTASEADMGFPFIVVLVPGTMRRPRKSPAPAVREITRPAGMTFSASTRIAIAAIHNTGHAALNESASRRLDIRRVS